MSEQGSGKGGSLELICGCMFSGKTERLLSRLAEARARAVPTAVFKHASDDRYVKGQLVTHTGRRTDAIALVSASRIPELAGEARLIVIDEAQFFDQDLVEACRQLVGQGREVVVAGLDRDAWGEPFGPTPEIEAIATKVTRTRAVCSACGEVAEYTQRLAPVEDRKMIGGAEAYEARCGKCFRAPPIELRR